MGAHRAKPQPTLEGYTAWAFARLMEAKGWGPAKTAEWIIADWIDSRRDILKDVYGITRDQFIRGDNVVEMNGNGKKSENRRSNHG